MPKLRVHNLAMSLDGFAAGTDQSLAPSTGPRWSPIADSACQQPVAT
jgi:hypothetical protein